MTVKERLPGDKRDARHWCRGGEGLFSRDPPTGAVPPPSRGSEPTRASLLVGERLPVWTDLYLGPLRAGADLRLERHEGAVLGQRLDLGDLAGACPLLQTLPHRGGEGVECDLLLDLQHAAVRGDADVATMAVHHHRHLIFELAVLGLARIALHGRPST